MEQFRIALFDDSAATVAFNNDPGSLSALGRPKWQQEQYIAYSYDEQRANEIVNDSDIDEQMKRSHVSWFRPTTNDFDIIIKKLYRQFKVTIFTTNAKNNQINEYAGDELKQPAGSFDGCQKFVDATGETIHQINFRGIESSHSSMVVNDNGLVGFKHMDAKDVQSLWNKIINAIAENHD